MKTLVLVRHAKSSWDDPSMSDFDRPLNERGKADAPEMAKRLKERLKEIDVFISSPAKRAKKTAKIFAEAFEVDKDKIKLVEDLYLAAPQVFYATVAGLNDKHKSAALFSHNPGITDYANSLADIRIDNVPTSGVFAVQADTEEWAGFADAKKTFLFFDYPKNV
jgi:phosphohistidine phosphatase